MKKAPLQSPWLAVPMAVGADAWALHLLITGRIQIDKRGLSFATRANDPEIYWVSWIIIATMAALLTWHALRLLRRD